MTYRELLELYKKNELNGNAKTEVEEDIEKQEAISDYLYEKAELTDFNTSMDQMLRPLKEGDAELNKAQEFSKMVSRTIRRAFLKMGMVIFTVVLAVILFIQFVLPEIVSSFYYNPAKEVAENTNQISLDMAVYSELAIPCYNRDNVVAEDKGYGNYDICIYQNTSYNGSFTNLSGKIEKGKLTLYDMNLLNRPSSNIFAWFQVIGGQSDSLRSLVSQGQTINSTVGNASDATEYLHELSDNTKYIAYVTLDRMMKYEDFMGFIEKWELLNVWCAVCTSGDGDKTKYTVFQPDNLGFMCTSYNNMFLNWDRNEYPNLQLWDNKEDIDKYTLDYFESLKNNMQNEAFMKTHFTSMLRYISGQKQFLSMMNENADIFSSAAAYVEKNGLIIYGFAAIADKEKLLNLNETDEVYEIYTQRLK